jgi:hypothetical protein
MSSEQISNEEKSKRKIRIKKDRVDLANKEEKNVKKKEKEDYYEQQSSLQQMKSFPKPLIYDPSNNSNQQRNVSLEADDSNIQDEQLQIIATDAKEITDYYLIFHKNMINIYNSIYYQILQDISNSYNNCFLTVNERLSDYSFEIENMYSNLNSNRDKSLKLIDNIITENLDIFIQSIKFTQKFYNDIIQSYFDCIRK